ncbi:protein I'm not dead yet-like isoform X2 [Teleopsis dalmanni]|uniref:protein I'm not dead yet-like isoform X2 n=1 Tax=Teleopsis dalmanni TaxID=139649 RepID=UPI0018CEAC83|nr:protein I'm not dead yet-like isoform X2 [Teleopsis dalmanni]XP_037939625.1 protein I'm not dead yet-like isoform X2 [Teleopsis dalmanni]
MENEQSESVSCGYACKSICRFHWRGIAMILVPLMLSPIFIMNSGEDAFLCLYIVCVIGIFWITEVLPLHITSIIPAFLLPMVGLLDSHTVCAQYFKDPLVMFLGGLMLALTVEYCNLHQRIALITIKIVGCSPRRLHLGLVLVGSFISMSMPNSATTAMMCPIIKAILLELHDQKIINIYDLSSEKEQNERDKIPSKIAVGYYLSTVYAITIGGCATLIGADTNLVFKAIYETRFPEADAKLDFPIYMLYAMPVCIIATFLIWLITEITNFGFGRPNSKESKEVSAGNENIAIMNQIINQKYKELGPMTCHEIQVVIIFLIMIILLFTRSPGFFVGWADILNEKQIESSMPTTLAFFVLFIFPIKYICVRFCKGKEKSVPWGLMFLLGGGFALAEASKQSGMTVMLGKSLAFAQNFPHYVVQLICIITGVFFTTFSANVAICNILIPVVCEMAVAIKTHPLYVVFPTGIAVSIAFLLPVSTPPNAIVQGYTNIRTSDMTFCGIGPTIICIILLFVNGQIGHLLIYGSAEAPSWALK